MLEGVNELKTGLHSTFASIHRTAADMPRESWHSGAFNKRRGRWS